MGTTCRTRQLLLTVSLAILCVSSCAAETECPATPPTEETETSMGSFGGFVADNGTRLADIDKQAASGYSRILPQDLQVILG